MKMMGRVVGLLLLATGVAGAQNQTASAPAYPTHFEVASVRLLEKPADDWKISDPGALLFSVHNLSLNFLIQMAYDVQDSQIEGQPAWMDSTFYDVSAKPDAEKGPTYEQLKPMLQQLLAQRFHLQTHPDQKLMKGYSLVVAKGGERLTPSKSKPGSGNYIMPKKLVASAMDMENFASMLTLVLKQPVHDDTGIQGRFDFKLEFAPTGVESTDSSLPSIFTALQEQLGLKLEPAKVPVKIIVIDHVDRVPTQN